jgi:hypothetical protein
MHFEHDDGGREKAGYKGNTRDCATRAIAIATGMPYQQAYDLVNEHGKAERNSKKRRAKSSARTGVYGPTMRRIMQDIGWHWTPTMGIGTGCTTHLRADELPPGRVLCSLSRHFAAIIDGTLHDLNDCSRDGTRCVYGYWTALAEGETP